jgi:hypothetical protein
VSLSLSIRAENLLDAVNVSPQLILEIDGLPLLGALKVTRIAKYGDPGLVFGMPGLVYGGLIEEPNSDDLIDLASSTNTITQQLLQDKGASASVTSMSISIVDVASKATDLFTPGNYVADPLGRKARVYLALVGGSHPEDSIQIFNGIIDNIDFAVGAVKVNVASPDALKRLTLFPKFSSELTLAINNTDTTLNVVDAAEFILPADGTTLRTYVRIEDEIIQYTGKTTTSLTGCTRGALGTTAVSHDIEATAESFYRVSGEAIPLALKLMLSGGDTYFAEDTPVSAFVSNGAETIANTIFFSHPNAQDRYGLVEGDMVTITGAVNGANNVTNAVITGFGKSTTGSYVTVTGVSMVVEIGASALAKFKSKYNVLPSFAGLGMTPEQVDVLEHERIYSQFQAMMFEYDYYVKEDINGAEFIGANLFFPSGCYQLFRKGRSSLGIMLPPIAQTETKVLNEDNLIDVSRVKVNRSINANFYNAVVYKYDDLALEDRYRSGKITQSAFSTNRIKIQNKPMVIEVGGVRQAAGVDNKIRSISQRVLDRYQYGAETLEVRTNFKTGFNIEVGDTVVLDGRSLNVPDSTNGTRVFQPRLMEVVNKSLSIKTGEVSLKLTDTAYNLDGRYVGIGPSSILASGCTTTKMVLVNSYGTTLTTKNESWKWEPFIGEKVKVRSEDWTVSEESEISYIDPANPNVVYLDTTLSFTPTAGYILEQPNYSTSADPLLDKLWKTIHGHWNNQVSVVSGVSNTSFNVSLLDAADLVVDSVIKVHDDTYTNVSSETRILSIAGTLVTTTDDLGFTPGSGYKLELLNFQDGGAPYRWI